MELKKLVFNFKRIWKEFWQGCRGPGDVVPKSGTFTIYRKGSEIFLGLLNFETFCPFDPVSLARDNNSWKTKEAAILKKCESKKYNVEAQNIEKTKRNGDCEDVPECGAD